MHVIHSSRKTQGCYCDGKPCFEVLTRRMNRQDKECYWCCQYHGYFEPKKMTEQKCPKNQQPKESHQKPSFNRGWKKL